MRLALVLIAASAVAAADDALVTRGYDDFYNLRYDAAIAEFTQYSAGAPQDPAGHNHVAQAILYRNMFRAGALETEMVTGNNPFLRRPKVNADAADRRAFDDHITRAIDLAQARLKRNPRDTEALYALGVSYGLRANYNFLIRKAWRDALRDATAARKAHAAVTEVDPSAIDARMVQGLHEYVVGSLPFEWQVLGFLIGFRGNRENGLHTVELVAAKGKANRLDAEFLLCAMYRREKQPKSAVPLIEDLIRRFPENYLLRMELAQMYSDLREPARALAQLAALRSQKKAGAPAYRTLPMEKICFAEGNIQFWYNDLDAALANLKQASAAVDQLDLNTGVLTWMRLGQIYDMKGNRGEALEAYQRAVALAPNSDAAKESREYLRSPYRRKQRG